MLDYLELCKQEVESQCRLYKVDKMLSNRPTISQAAQNLALSEDDEISNKGRHKEQNCSGPSDECTEKNFGSLSTEEFPCMPNFEETIECFTANLVNMD